MMAWPYDHGTKGTCIPGCPAWGICHCGCGQPARWSSHTHRKRKRIRGRPMIFLPDHGQKVASGAYRRTGVLLDDRVWKMLTFLKDRHGSWRAVAQALDVNENTVWSWVGGFTTRISPGNAQKIVDAVLLLRTGQSPLPTHDDDVKRRLPTKAEKEAQRREAARKWRAYYRSVKRGGDPVPPDMVQVAGKG